MACCAASYAGNLCTRADRSISEELESLSISLISSGHQLPSLNSISPGHVAALTSRDQDTPAQSHMQARCSASLYAEAALSGHPRLSLLSLGPVDVSNIRAVHAQVRQLILSAQLDIPGHAWLAPQRWNRLCDALQLLGLRAAALECILEGAHVLGAQAQRLPCVRVLHA